MLLRIEQITGNALNIEQGALYPALYRLEHRGLLDTGSCGSDSATAWRTADAIVTPTRQSRARTNASYEIA